MLLVALNFSLKKVISINTQIGGVMLPFDRLCIGSLEHLWHQESFIALDESENIISMGGHQVSVSKIMKFHSFSHFTNTRGRGCGSRLSQSIWIPARSTE